MTPSWVAALSEDAAAVAGPATAAQIAAAQAELGVRFPEAYRRFLESFGAGRLKWLDIFGVPRNRLWGDVVMMNQFAPVKPPPGCVLFARDLRGNFYYLEAPSNYVIRLGVDGKERWMAGDFDEFLCGVAEVQTSEVLKTSEV